MKVVHLAREGFCPVSPESPFSLAEKNASKRLEALVDDYCQEWKKADVFLIDACFSPSGTPADSFGGITLLKLIRMKGLRQHAIVYSPLPLSFLLRQGYHEILMSAGTSYEWLPSEIDEDLCRERMGRLAEEDLSVFFLPEYNALLRMERHSLANWWGVLRLYHAMEAAGLLPRNAPDQQMREALERENSYQGRLMSYVRFRGRVPSIKYTPHAVEAIRARVEQIRRRNLKVVYVDDQAAEGWSCLLQRLLYGGPNPERFLTPTVGASSQDVQALTWLIRAAAPDLVVMDLRLLDDDRGPNPSGLEAIRLLSKEGEEIGCPILAFTASNKREISEKAIQLGADAVWTKEGIDEAENLAEKDYFYFTKARFNELVTVLGSFIMEERLMLWDFLRSIKEIEMAPGKFWWERRSWYPGDTVSHRPLVRKVVTDRLRNVCLTQKQAFSSLLGRPDRNLYEKLIIELIWILEVVHNAPQTKKGSMRSLAAQTENTWPEGSEAFALLRDLIKMRNTVVHAGMKERDVHGFGGYRDFLSMLMCYLTADTSRFALRENPQGVLVRDVDAPGRYNLQRDDGTEFRVRREDTHTCEKMLEGRDGIPGVGATLRTPVPRYDFFAMKAAGDSAPGDRWWSMKVVKIHEYRFAVQAATKDIHPRPDARFCVPEPAAEALETGMRIFFHVYFQDRPEGDGELRIFDLTPVIPTAMLKTYWSGIVGMVERDASVCRIGLKVIFPPGRWSFLVPLPIWEEMDDTEYRLLFLPDWEQIPSVSGLRTVCMAVPKEGEPSDGRE